MKNARLFGKAIVISLLVFCGVVIAAPRQKVLVEHFTNADCGPCATYNPGIHSVLNAMTRDTVVKISYHVWWPGPSDPFYLWNTSEVQARTNYYGVTAVPDLFVDYTLQPAPSSPTTLRNNIRTRYATGSPCTIDIVSVPVSPTSIHVTATVTADQNMNGGNYRVYAVLITNVVTYSSPPGTNGETVFPDPFRDIYPNANPGQSFSILSGESYVLDCYLNKSSAWNPNDLSVVVFVQNSTNRDIAQTNWVPAISTPGTITLTSPNGGETWIEGDVRTIQWTSQNLPDSIRVEINRTFPSSTWVIITPATANTGSYTWTVTAPSTTTARVRVTGQLQTSARDTSDGNFTILGRTITVLAPNGGESYLTGDNVPISWTSQYVTGTVDISVNRSYPGGSWSPIASGIPYNGSYNWTATGPSSSATRIRVTSASYPNVFDDSDDNFTILVNEPPSLSHNPLDDQDAAPFTVTALAHDERPGMNVWFVYRPVGGLFDSLAMTATGNPDEYAVTVGALAEDNYEYLIRARDALGQSSQTAINPFEVAWAGGRQLAYDDGTAESSQWAINPEFRWAVKFSVEGGQFMLCGAQIGISSNLPSDVHSPIHVAVLLADGLGGLPGTTVFEKTVGSVGNVIGGVPDDPAAWADVRFRDGSGQPITVSGDFYIAVDNPVASQYESFLNDTLSLRAGNSYVYNPCTDAWVNEVSADSVVRPGNRMIRASGFSMEPPNVTAARIGNDIELRWNDLGTPFYHVYSALSAVGPFETLEDIVSTNSYLDVGAVTTGLKKFYIVRSATE